MRWFPFILLCLLIYIEAVIFVGVAESIGVLTTLILVVLTSCLGISLVKSQGIKNLLLIRQKLAEGENPAEEMIKNVALVIAGILLILPGFFTDFLGLLLLFSPIQKLIVMKLMPHIQFYSAGSTNDNFNPFAKGNTYEGKLDRKSDDLSNSIKHEDKFSKKEDHDDKKY
ncbi:MAG: FxsA family protein [Arsenophonus endosymbiont of Dermacentor nuttalli]